MSFVRRLRLPLAFAAVLTSVACGDPPDKELQQARSAIESARVAGADLYAREEFSAAETALKSATDAVDQRDYRLALNRALDARERAQNAVQEAVSRKAVVRADASRALALAGRALDDQWRTRGNQGQLMCQLQRRQRNFSDNGVAPVAQTNAGDREPA